MTNLVLKSLVMQFKHIIQTYSNVCSLSSHFKRSAVLKTYRKTYMVKWNFIKASSMPTNQANQQRNTPLSISFFHGKCPNVLFCFHAHTYSLFINIMLHAQPGSNTEFFMGNTAVVWRSAITNKIPILAALQVAKYMRTVRWCAWAFKEWNLSWETIIF